jgi:hypothetical protein
MVTVPEASYLLVGGGGARGRRRTSLMKTA